MVVDDQFPLSTDTDNSENHTWAHSSDYPSVIWPAIVEKAFLKVTGGTTFEGSNSASDLRLLIGWIPQEISLCRRVSSIDGFWSKLKDKWDRGDVLITLGTSKNPSEEAEQAGIIAEHSYAVTSMSSRNGRWDWTVQNPWLPTCSLANQSFDFEFTAISTFFNNMFLSWNPSLYRCQLDAHFNIEPDQLGITEHNIGKTDV